MTRPGRRLLVRLLALVLLALSSCHSRDRSVATLVGISGSAERDHAAAPGSWEGAAVGAKFVVGDGVRTAANSTALLRLLEKERLALEPRTLLRFLDHASDPRHARIALEMGQATLDAADEPLEVETEVGTARLAPHGQLRFSRGDNATRVEVTIGSAEVLRNGQRWQLEVGDAVDVRFEQPLRHGPATAPSSSAAAGDSSAPPAPAASAATTVDSASAPSGSGAAAASLPSARGPERVDLLVHPGDSLVIHDPRPPTAVGVLTAGRCAGSAVLSFGSGHGRAPETIGEAQVSAALAPGSHHYVLRCVDAKGERGDKIGEGTIAVVADAGSRQLAKSAPATDVDTDGRRYTVLYQSLLPRISVRWPNAPAADGYTLRVSSPNGSKSYSSRTASFAFTPGALLEGDHTLTFEGAGARSRTTSLAIRFDNAAPTASISAPNDGSFAPGQSVQVAGTALPGWSVSIGGDVLTQDAQNRFSTTASAPAGLGALAIRFAQPQRGVHYYLRRCAR